MTAVELCRPFFFLTPFQFPLSHRILWWIRRLWATESHYWACFEVLGRAVSPYHNAIQNVHVWYTQPSECEHINAEGRKPNQCYHGIKYLSSALSRLNATREKIPLKILCPQLISVKQYHRELMRRFTSKGTLWGTALFLKKLESCLM